MPDPFTGAEPGAPIPAPASTSSSTRPGVLAAVLRWLAAPVHSAVPIPRFVPVILAGAVVLERTRPDRRLMEAIGAYTDLHWGRAPDRVDQVDAPGLEGNTLVQLGDLEYVGYYADKGPESAIWHHEFDGADRPRLSVDLDSGSLHLIGGSYSVDPRGIVG